LSDALKHFKVAITAKEQEAESELLAHVAEPLAPVSSSSDAFIKNVLKVLEKYQVGANELREPSASEQK
jgi:hypothetical protein